MKQAKALLIGQRSLHLVSASFLPDDAPKAVVVLVHGYGEHTGRYTHVIAALVQRGYAVYTIDHRGHGESQGRRALVERFDYFVSDLRLLVQRAVAAHPTLPIVLLGHSMGGLIAFHYVVRYQDAFAGLVLSGPALASDVAPHLRRVAPVLGTVVPWLPLAPVARGPDSVLSRDPQVQKLFDADPLTYKHKMKAGMGYQLMRAINDAQPLMHKLTLPLLIMHGAADRLTNPSGSQLLYERAQSADKTLKFWTECRHEIFNEPEKDEVIAFTLDWLDVHVRSTAAQPADRASA